MSKCQNNLQIILHVTNFQIIDVLTLEEGLFHLKFTIYWMNGNKQIVSRPGGSNSRALLSIF